jgi:hypothetical protein
MEQFFQEFGTELIRGFKQDREPPSSTAPSN